MAENKKGFILYANWWLWLEDLTPQQKAEWVDWLFNYVNDKNPSMPRDQTLKIVCKMTKTQLKEDLEKWQDIREKRIEAGKKGGLATQSKNKQNEANALNGKPNQAVNDNVNVNVNVNDNVNIFKEKNNIKKEKEQIKTLTEFLEELQELFGMLAPKYNDLAVKMYNDLGYQNAINEIKSNMNQPNPINATYLKLYNNKVESSGSEWLDKMKKGL